MLHTTLNWDFKVLMLIKCDKSNGFGYVTKHLIYLLCSKGSLVILVCYNSYLLLMFKFDKSYGFGYVFKHHLIDLVCYRCCKGKIRYIVKSERSKKKNIDYSYNIF